MNKIRELLDILRNKDRKDIYGRVLRVAIFGSLLTFAVMALLSVFFMLIIRGFSLERSKVLSENVGDYLELTVEDEIENHLIETTVLKSKLVGRILKNCALNAEVIASEMSDIMQNPANHKKRNIPVANFEDIPPKLPYLYYDPNLLQKGIDDNLLEEVKIVSSIEDEMRRVNRKFYTNMMVASEHGYMIRMDIATGKYPYSVLSNEPFRSSYDFLERSWYKNAKNVFLSSSEKDGVIFTNPYVSIYGVPCISVFSPYYDKNGFAGIVGIDLDREYIAQRIDNTGENEKDYTFILNKNGEILISSVKKGIFSMESAGKDLRNESDKNLSEAVTRMARGDTGIATVKADGTEYYLAYTPIKETVWSVGAIVDRKEVTEEAERLENYVNIAMGEYHDYLNKLFIVMALVASGIFIVVLWFIIRKNTRMAKSFAAPVKLLTDGVEEITKGNLDKKLEVKTGDELETLAAGFNTMTDALTEYIKRIEKSAAERERIKTELEVAKGIQTGILPYVTEEIKNHKEFDLAALMEPAREVGGDFYDFYMLDDKHLVFTVADVSDKGIPAALFMVMAKTILKETLLFKTGRALGEIFENANNALVKINTMNMFVTVFTGILNIENGEFIYANAGHNPPVIITKDGASYLGRALSPIMGAIEDIKFKTVKTTLKRGETLLLYTDGVTEARRGNANDMFGEDRLLKVAATLDREPQVDIESVYEKVKEYADGTPQSDDITILEVLYRKE